MKLTLAGAFLALCLAGALVWARARLDASIRDGLREAGRRLGRPIVVSAIQARLVPSLEVTLSGISIGGDGRTGARLFTAASLRVRLSLWQLLRSRGRAVVIDELELRAPTLRVVLLPDGRTSLDDLRARRAAPPTPTPTPAALTALRITRASLRGGALDIVDAADGDAAPRTLSLRSIDVVADRLGPERDATVRLAAALLGDAKNVRANLSLGPLRVRQGAVVAPAVRAVELAYDRVEVAPALASLARRRPLRILRGAFTGHTRVELDARAKPRRIATSFAVAGLVLRRRDGALRPPVEARVDAEVSLDEGAVNVPIFHVTLDGMSLAGEARVATGEHPALLALSLSSSAIALERLEPWLPARTLPPGAVLEGPLVLRAQAARAPDGATALDAALDLTGATVRVPDVLHKPAGTRLSAEFRGRVRERDVTVERAGVTLGPLVVALRGAVRSARAFDLAFDTGEVPIEPLLRLLPRVRAEVPEATALHGRLRASGALRTEGDTHAGRLVVALRGADAHTPTLALTGEADASLAASVTGDRLRFDATLDATGARVMVQGRVDKAADAPLHVAVRGARAGRRITVASLTAQLPGVRLDASGTWDAATRRATLRAPTCELDLARLIPALPGVAPRVPAAFAQATARGDVTFEGGADDLRDARLRVEGLALRSEVGDLHGRFDLAGLDEPRRARFDLWGGVLDVDRLARALPPSRAPRGGLPSWWRTADLEGSLRADALRLSSQTLASPRAELTLRDGRLLARTLSAGAFGGAVRGDGSWFESAASSLGVGVHLRARHVDLFALTAATGADLAARLTGSLDVDADLTAEGADGAALRANLEGTLHLTATNVVARRLVSPMVSVVLPLVGARRAGSGAGRDAAQPMTVLRAEASVRLDSGAIRTTAPLRLDTDAGEVTLTGRVNADRTLALAGQVRVPPEVIARVTHGDLMVTSPVPVSIRVVGRTDAPEVQVVDLAATIAALAGSRLRALTRGLFQ